MARRRRLSLRTQTSTPREFEYSDYFRAELDDEVHKHLPEYERYLDILRHIGGWQFDRTHFERVCTQRPDLAEEESSGVILEKLFRYSIIAFIRAGGRGYGRLRVCLPLSGAQGSVRHHG